MHLGQLLVRYHSTYAVHPHDVRCADDFTLTAPPRRLNTTTPCLTYGLRGIAYFSLKISGPARDLHSGVFGGSTHEPMTDLVKVLSTLVQPDGKILVPGLAELVAPLKEGELERYEKINFSIADIENA